MLQDLRTTANRMTTHNISDSEIPPAKARRAPSSDNYFLCGLCVFAGDIPHVRLRLCRARYLCGEYFLHSKRGRAFFLLHFASGTFFRRVSRKPAGNGSLFSSIARFALTHASEYLSCSYRENAHSRQLRAYL